jgi:hypothetical protein
MKTITVNLYSFNELTEEAKQKAIDSFRDGDNYFYFNEVEDSVKKVIDLFNLRTGNYYSDIRTGHIDDCILQLSGVRLCKYLVNNYFTDLFKPEYIKTIDGRKKWGKLYFCKYFTTKDGKQFTQIYSKWKKYSNDCTLTGACYDNDILKPVYDFLSKPDKHTTYEDLMQDIGNAISKTYQNVDEWVNSDEFIIDSIEANEYQFTEDGKLY